MRFNFQSRVIWIALLVGLLSLAACTAPQIAPVLPQPGTPVAEETNTPPAEATESPSESENTASAETETFQDVPVGFTAEGYPFRGNPDAPITVYEYSDFQCPFCARHVIQTEPALKESYLRSGDVKFVFRDLPLDTIHPNATQAAVAANCVAEQGIVPYWQMHDLLFRTQSEWGSLEDPSETLTRLATEAGADAEQYATCLAETTEEKTDAIQESIAEASSYGFTGTPSFRFVREETGETFDLVGAQPYEVFADYLDTLAAGGTPADPAQAQQQQGGQAEFPAWATAEGLAPDPDRPGMTMAGDFWRGNPDAPVVVVEFSDFQCPFCQRHTLDTQPVLDEQFVDPGDVMWVFKHFPVEQTHPQAVAAAGAAECAGEQGKFWEMHELLFERMDEWSVSDADAVLTSLAEELGLDMDAYSTCFEAQETYQAVLADLQAGSEFIRGTPTFVVIYGDKGQLIPGALPADQFSGALTQMLEEARSLESE